MAIWLQNYRAYTRGDRRCNRPERSSQRLPRRSLPRQSPRRSPHV